MIYDLGIIKQSRIGDSVYWSAKHVLEKHISPTEEVIQCEKMIVHAVNGATGKEAQNEYIMQYPTTNGYAPIDADAIECIIETTINSVN